MTEIISDEIFDVNISNQTGAQIQNSMKIRHLRSAQKSGRSSLYMIVTVQNYIPNSKRYAERVD